LHTIRTVFRRSLAAAALAVLLAVQAAALPETLIPGGNTLGIELDADGVLVVGFDDGTCTGAGGLKKGDLLRTVNGQPLRDTQTLLDALQGCGGAPLTVTALRSGRETSILLRPKYDDGTYRLGLFVRDSMAGIGTMTYYDPETGAYGALGHGVSDLDASTLLPLQAGRVLRSTVIEVRKGTSGAPGELKGAFDVRDTLGTIDRNTACGIFGTLAENISQNDPLPVAGRDEVTVGQAAILCNVQGQTVSEYAIEIEKLLPTGDGDGRNFMIRVTDPELLRLTGGIVQGMSGSPIVENGKIVGAVTHVLVNDPTAGYGIFIENMLEAAA
jgi:stage IV sporulation protein B